MSQSQKMGPSEAFVETLAANGVTHVFGIVGSAFMDALDIFPAAGIRFIPVAHEQGAIHMADGYARVSGRHGVCIAQNGPGITNFVTGVAAAYWAHSPVVVITPETGSHDAWASAASRRPSSCRSSPRSPSSRAHVNNPQAHGRDHRALLRPRHARDGPDPAQHPARLLLRRDRVRDPAADARSSRGAGGAQGARRGRRSCSPRRKFPGDPRRRRRDHVAAAPPRRSRSPNCSARRCATATCTTTRSPHRIRSRCGPLGYQGSKAAMKLIAQADVVLALGTRLGPFGTLPQHGLDYWPKKAKIIQIDADPRMLGLVKPISVGIYGDARAAAAALLERLKGQHARRRGQSRRARRAGSTPRSRPGRRELDGWTHERDAYSIEVARGSEYMHPRQMLRELEKAMPDNAMVSTDIGNICSVAELLPALRCAALHVRRDELRQLRLRLSDHLRRQGRRARPAGVRLRRRRRVGHQLQRAADLRAREDRRHRGRVQQRPVGRGEEESRRFLLATAIRA